MKKIKPHYLCCIWCGGDIPKDKPYAKYCSQECRNTAMGSEIVKAKVYFQVNKIEIDGKEYYELLSKTINDEKWCLEEIFQDLGELGFLKRKAIELNN